MLRQLLHFTTGLLLAILFAMAAMTALAGTFVLGKDAIEAKGDAARFEARVRHYTDRLEQARDGALVLRRAAHPVAELVGSVAIAWLLAIGLGLLLRRLQRRPFGP